MVRERELLGLPLPPDAQLPAVLIQIPTFNEGTLVRRTLAAAMALDWPRDRLQVQVLDDSTNESAKLAREAVVEFRGNGLDQGGDVVRRGRVHDVGALAWEQHGRPPVEAETRSTGRNAVLRICDRGPGVAEAERARMFLPFQRSGAADARSGTGLGLALVRQIAERHGGTVVYGPCDGRASCFTVTLALARSVG